MRIGFVGLGDRIARVARMPMEAKPSVALAAHTDPSPAGLPTLKRPTARL